MFLARFCLPAVAALALLPPASAQTPESPSPRWNTAFAGASSRKPQPDSALEAGATSCGSPAAPEGADSADDPGGPPPAPAIAPAVTVQQSGNPAATTPPSAEQPPANQRALAEQQLKRQEKQRVMGLLPSFNVSYDPNAVSLTGRQKMRLALRTSLDPFTFATAFVAAGYHEARNDQSGFPWGAKGYFERAGTGYLDSFDGNVIGNGLLPALLHQEPRYFRRGHGSFSRRLLYAASTAFICKHDNTGKWEPNYSNIGGNIIAGAISNAYYPGNNTGVGLTISNGMVVTTEGIIGTMLQEFWPDISRKFLHRDPTRATPR